MAKEKFIRTKPHCNVGTIGHVDHGKTALTAAMTKVSADNGWGTFVSYHDVAKASAAQGTRDATKILTIAASHVEYSTAERHYSHVDCPGHADYVKKHDHGCRPDGRRDPARVRSRWGDAADARAYPARTPSRCAAHRRVPEQVRRRGRRRAARPHRARGARTLVEAPV